MPMKIEILNEKENKPLARKEIAFKIDHAGASTPSRADIRAKLVTLNTHYGIGVTEGSIHIYSDPEQMKRIELDHMVKRHESKKKEGEK
jgi:small subunit ribosomal protein S24e